MTMRSHLAAQATNQEARGDDEQATSDDVGDGDWDMPGAVQRVQPGDLDLGDCGLSLWERQDNNARALRASNRGGPS
eukprot:674390-Pyramimonas_sp.AAC.1